MPSEEKKVKLTIEMDNLTVPQALALKAFFQYWRHCANAGCSREIGFFVDGDGDFNSKLSITCDQELPYLTEELAEKAVVKDHQGNRVYDYDPIAWDINHPEDKAD